MASSSSISVFDNHRFKTAFNEELYNTIVKNKKMTMNILKSVSRLLLEDGEGLQHPNKRLA
ncbi:hypothetical protein PIB30_073967 [Stylosanthes scabra]|uniref:Uncharacterized protein n=1 Tax=Stylosanthes scabra TaxID=79078 RepID=A0ABU6UR93_9FABA|nr:hypothetical protein [Stylosanthes scabra]